MGIVPVLNENNLPSIALSDRLFDIFSKSSSDICVLSPDMMFDAADKDSVSDASYWIRFGSRLGLAYLLLAQMDTYSNIDSLSLSCWDYDAHRFLNTYKSSEFESDSILSLQVDKMPLYIKKTSEIHDYKEMLSSALKAYCKGRYHSLFSQDSIALQYYNLALKDIPNHPNLLIKKAECLIRIGENNQIKGKSSQAFFLEAEEIFSSIPDINQFRLSVTLLKARLSVYQSAWNRAEMAIREALSLNPNQSEIYLLLSRLHSSRYKKFGYKSQKQLYIKALSINPAFVDGYLALGDWFYFNHESQKAEDVYQHLLFINPRSIDGLLALGKIYLYRNESLKLIEIYERLLSFHPGKPEILYNLGIAYFNENNYPKAISLFNNAANHYHYPNAYYYLGVIYMKQCRYSEAISAFRQRILLRRGPDDMFANEAVKHLYQLLHMQKENNSK